MKETLRMHTLKLGSALGAALTLALSAASAHADAIVNGGFESGLTAPWVTTCLLYTSPSPRD